MWERRFATPEYIFGTAPSEFLLAHRDLLVPGQTALAVADGEGRNSVFMAECGMTVTALEYAPSAIEKARKLAAERGVEVDFRNVDVLHHDWPDSYDLVAGIFIQFVGPDQRAVMLDGMKRSVRPGGIMLLHGFTPKQLEYGTGGPSAVENLYTEDMLRDAFAGWDIAECRSYERDLDSGAAHSGRAALIDLVAYKPA